MGMGESISTAATAPVVNVCLPGVQRLRASVTVRRRDRRGIRRYDLELADTRPGRRRCHEPHLVTSILAFSAGGGGIPGRRAFRP